MTQQDVHDSPVDWVNEHTRQYVESGGEQGHDWNGVPTLLLTTTGRKSGVRRRTALIYGTSPGGSVDGGDAYVVVASKGGAPEHPAWFLNLQADPDVEVQVGPEVLAARARVATGEERERLWRDMAVIWPAYDEYATKTEREIPVVVLDRR
ncbi:MAG TPA: nitroreductase family deazaflavin-dependent oxidoreductase [Actinomycetales bacterium]|jgi:deazaflavin-dependent oxidoreductase (nitroreductase family)